MPILALFALAAVQAPLAPSAGPLAAPPSTHAASATCAPDWLPTYGPGMSPTIGGVDTLCFFDGGQGTELYVTSSGTGSPSTPLKRWDGSTWRDVGGFTHLVEAMVVADLGAGPSLYVGGPGYSGGSTDRVRRWDGSAWHWLGAGTNGPVWALTLFDDGSGPALIVGGSFTTAGNQQAARIARWDGATWEPLGSGINIHSSKVLALESADLGSGPALYVGGRFTRAGGIPVQALARWDGQSWADVGGGVSWPPSTVGSEVRVLQVFDDGTGPALYVAGDFTHAGGAPISGFARWDGQSWSSVGGGVNGEIYALEVFDDGSGPALYVGGDFSQAGGVPADGVARWNGSSWSALTSPSLPGSFSGLVLSLAAAPDDFSGTLFLGGIFDSPSGDEGLTRWGCDRPVLGAAFCFGDGSGASCPCGNAGGPGEGCANSTGGGATLAAAGSASVSAGDLVLLGAGLPPAQPGLFFQGRARVNGGSGAPFGDGLRCAGQDVVRLEVAPASAAGDLASATPIAATGGVSPGDTRVYQLLYRDPLGSPCSAGFNLTGGLELDWLP